MAFIARSNNEQIVDGTLSTFLRVLAFFYLVFAIRYWSMVIGYPDLQIFVSQPLLLQVTIVIFSVLHPVAALGLWLGQRWGVILWLLTASVEIVICLQTGDRSFLGWSFLVFHAVAITTWILISVSIFLSQRKRRALES